MALLIRMEDADLQERVESLLGPGARVVDCEKKSIVREEEVLLVNGARIPLAGDEGVAIREALLRGAPHLLGEILVRAGVLPAAVRLETQVSVRSSVVTREQVTLSKDGRLLDGRSTQSKHSDFYSSSTSELWEPYPTPPPSSSTPSSSSCEDEDQTDFASSVNDAFDKFQIHNRLSVSTYN